MESPLFPIVFWCNAREASLIGAVSLFKFRHIEHLVVAAITALVVHRALPLMSRFENRVSPRGTEGSNPSPSSGESAANLTSSIRAPMEQPFDTEQPRLGRAPSELPTMLAVAQQAVRGLRSRARLSSCRRRSQRIHRRRPRAKHRAPLRISLMPPAFRASRWRCRSCRAPPDAPSTTEAAGPRVQTPFGQVHDAAGCI